MQDAQNLAWKLALALKGGNLERLLDSYNQERRPAITSFVLRFTTYSSRIIFAAARLGLIPMALWAGRLALRNSQVRRAAGRGFAMLGTHYNQSPLIFGERKWAGRRAPGGPLAEPTIISFGVSAQTLRGFEEAMTQLKSDPRLPVIAAKRSRKPTRCGGNGRPGRTWSCLCVPTDTSDGQGCRRRRTKHWPGSVGHSGCSSQSLTRQIEDSTVRG
jgi:hypothetical protein